ncbi:MAG: glycine cleavage system protein R [Oceanobacter sp.]
MKLSYVLTVIADDKPGLVEILSTVVKEHQGNWLGSRMASLAGKFAGIVHIEVATDQAALLEKSLAELSGQGIDIRIEPGKEAAQQTRIMTLSLVGNDRPGIVRELAHAMSELDINVLELITNCASAEMTAQPLFRAEATLEVPMQLDQDDISSAVESLGNEFMVDLQIS